MSEVEIQASVFKARCLALLDEAYFSTGELWHAER